MNHQLEKILVVEDEPAQRKAIETVLYENGYKVVTARDAAEALEKFKEEKPFIVLMDIKLGDNRHEDDGIEAMNKMLKIRKDFVRIFCSAYSGKDMYQKRALRDAPHHHWIAKSNYEFASLAAEIKYAVAKYEVQLSSEQANKTKQFVCKHNNKLIHVSVDNIVFVEINRKHSCLNFYTEDKEIYRSDVNYSIATFMKDIKNDDFLRISGSCVINRKYLANPRVTEGGGHILLKIWDEELSKNKYKGFEITKTLEIGKTFRSSVLETLGIKGKHRFWNNPFSK